MFTTTRLVAAALGALMVLTPLATAEEMFNDATTGAPEPNAFDGAYSDAQNYWSNVRHTAEDDAAKGLDFARLHGHGAGEGELSDWAGTSTTADARPHIDLMLTNWYGALIMSDPNDAAQGNLMQRFTYPGFTVLTVLYGYYNECVEGSYKLSGPSSGTPSGGAPENGADSIDDAKWCGNPAFVESTEEINNDELVPIYWTHGGSAPQMRDHLGEEDGTSHLSGTHMMYAEILEPTNVATLPTIPVELPDLPDLPVEFDFQNFYDQFDEDCAEGGEYEDECTAEPIVFLWNQRITCGAEDDADRNKNGGAEHSTGNGCVGGAGLNMPNSPLSGTFNPYETALNDVVVPDSNGPQQIGDQLLNNGPDACYLLGQNPNANGCENGAKAVYDEISFVDSAIPEYLDTPDRPSYRSPPAPPATGPEVQLGYLDTRRGDWTADAYQSGLITNPMGSALNGMHIVVWVGPAHNLDERGNVLSFVENPNGWTTATTRDVDYFNAAGEGAGSAPAAIEVNLLGLLGF